MDMKSRAATIASVTIALAACGSAGSGGGGAGEDRTLDPSAETVFTYGTAFGDATEMLGDQVDIGFDSSGRLYALDAGNYRVVVVGPDGSFEREFGQQGDGPGELSRPIQLVVEADGSTAVLDARSRSFVRFDPSGAYIESVRARFGYTPEEQEASLAGDGEVVFLGEGFELPVPGGARGTAPRAAAQGMAGRGSAARGGRAGGGMPSQADIDAMLEIRPTIPVRRFSMEDGTSQVLFEAWRPQLPPSELDDVGQGQEAAMQRFFSAATVGFLPTVQVGAFADGRVAVADSSTYEIHIIGRDGSLETTLGREMAPRPVDEMLQQMEKDRRIEEIEAGDSPLSRGVASFGMDMGGRGGGIESAVIQQMIIQAQLEEMETMQFAPEVPVIRAMRVDPAGLIWVERTPERLAGPGPIDIFSVDNGYLGTFEAGELRLPDAFGPDGLIAYLDRDEYDVPTIRVVRIPALGG